MPKDDPTAGSMYGGALYQDMSEIGKTKGPKPKAHDDKKPEQVSDPPPESDEQTTNGKTP